MSLFWIIGSIFYYFSEEIHQDSSCLVDMEPKGISFLLACYNEEETVEETIQNVLKLNYPIKEIIVINDGSKDRTAEIVYDLQNHYDFKFVDLEINRGKANALNTGIKYAQYEYVMCLDADTIVDNRAPYFMLERFEKNPELGAVTGNPRIRNKSTLLGKIQTVEYASLIGSIKRAQSIAGKVNTISGVFTLFRKSAIEKVGLWDTDMITEDIAISWKFHLNDIEIEYEPRAMCWMLVPESVHGLWKQRVRWAQGGHEVLIRDFKEGFKKGKISIFILLFEQIFSITWVYAIIAGLVKTISQSNLLSVYHYEYQFTIFLLSAFTLTFINMIQLVISLMIDSRYERRNIFLLPFLCWYPIFYWIINATVVIAALPKALKRKKGEFATWTSPDRGNIQR
ncbi:poly-beta-1,6 N-acetyl-D-glucosamine synthase [Staphylococcus massiliensis]|uniref:poly-beta-1,6-N-acetyl-D-glucosamine synthase n=1 Tax=Staphylococcus massiliensis TaxID=555791 RepID=UPI001EDDCD9B|nr:poly-beta-1,6-N-acetyl-D-glucosamine synthase [Staphylococcus massiliensis]MCG3401745.1 poly-beta-1,6 N-acetyl-D-glucosamine synthase [Staphylococcus massiliensis]